MHTLSFQDLLLLRSAILGVVDDMVQEELRDLGAELAGENTELQLSVSVQRDNQKDPCQVDEMQKRENLLVSCVI